MSRKARLVEKGCNDVITRVENIVFASKGTQQLEDELSRIARQSEEGKLPGFLPVNDPSKLNFKRNHNHPVPFKKGKTHHETVLNLITEADRYLTNIGKNSRRKKVSSMHKGGDSFDEFRRAHLIPLRKKFGENLVRNHCLREVIEEHGLSFSREMILEAAWLQAAQENTLLGKSIEYVGGTMRRCTVSPVSQDIYHDLYGKKLPGKPSEIAEVISRFTETSRIITTIEAISSPQQRVWESSLNKAFAATFNEHPGFSCESLDVRDILNLRHIPFSELIITRVETGAPDTYRFLAYGYK
jgi:hypothetical protein